MKKWILLGLIIFPLLLLFYFSLGRNPRDLPSALIGKTAPSFALQNLDSEIVESSQFIGKPTVVNFWSTWCGPCVVEHQLTQMAMRRFQTDGVQFYAILYEDTVENAQKFLNRYGPGATVLLDPGLKTAINYGVYGVPETFFVNRDGLIVYRHTGAMERDVLMEQIENLL